MRALILLSAVFAAGFSKCIKDGDVAFVMDVGGHVGAEELSDMKSAVTEATSYLAVGPKKAQVAVATFGGRGPIVFVNFFKATSSAKIAKRIGKIQPVTGGEIRFAGHALGRLSRIMFNETKGDRPDRQNYMMVVMAGPSQWPDQLKAKAAQLTQSGIIVVALGIGHDIPQEQLAMVASKPQLIFRYDNSTMFKQRFPRFFKHVVVNCNCMNKADILFMMDTAEGATMQGFEAMKSAVKNVTSWLEVGTNANVALASFGGGIKTGFNFRWKLSSKNVHKVIGKFSKVAGKKRKMFKLFRFFDKIFSARKGARRDVEQYVIVFVCGPAHRSKKFLRKAKKYAMVSNKKIIAVGVGSTVPEDELQALASQPTLAIRIKGIGNIPDAVEKIKDIALNCK